MTIIHHPQGNTQPIIDYFNNGIRTVTYVCTTELTDDNTGDTHINDVYVQWPRHEAYGNQYFGHYTLNGENKIHNADRIDDYIFGMVQNDDGDWEYSIGGDADKVVFENGNWIDGGRATIDYNVDVGDLSYWRLANGEFFEVRIDD